MLICSDQTIEDISLITNVINLPLLKKNQNNIPYFNLINTYRNKRKVTLLETSGH